MPTEMPECPICYESKELIGIHSCSHCVCAGCLIRLIKHGLHHECSYCRSALTVNYTIGVSTVDHKVAALMNDEGSGILIENGTTLTKFEHGGTPAMLSRRLGDHTATVVRLDGKTILYGAVIPTQPRFLDCFFKVPRSSEDSRRGRALRRRLMQEGIQSTVLSGIALPLHELMRTLVFPVMLIDVVDPPELELGDDEDYSAF